MESANKRYLPAEWYPQAFVQLTWPHEETDWAYMLDEALICYYNMAREISKREKLLIVAPDTDLVRHQLESGLDGKIKDSDRVTPDMMKNISFFTCPTNDTWARDHAFITCLEADSTPLLMDFQFNGWGLKFASCHDNMINRRMHQKGIVSGHYESRLDFVFEGGSIESDGHGTLLTTSSCLLAPNRNEGKDKGEIEEYLKKAFNAERVLWLEHGWIKGDDTDGHIDTLARLCPNDTIVYQSCNDSSDEHYTPLKEMENEIKSFLTADGKPYKTAALPLCDHIYDESGYRLPATYANFLIMNTAVLFPTYRQPECDNTVRTILQDVFPDKEIIGIDCTPLVFQHGSLHCCTMQYPKEVKLND